ncbi:MAG: HEAT repeat domain-containing protein [Dehalococcoidia bacterium]|nr:MAG: HEAT repeat domain-containing protein [Dehalococcoidia bacterium]
MIDISKKLGIETIGELQSKKDVGALINIVEKSKYPSDVRFAINALGMLKAKTAVEPIICALLSDSFQDIAVRALGDIGSEKAVRPLCLLLQNVHTAKLNREAILHSLGKIASKEAAGIIINYLDTDIGEIALSVLKNLGTLGVGELIFALGTDLRDTAIAALGQIGENAKEATVPLLKILETVIDKEAPECNVLMSLALIKDHDAVEPLINAIKYNTSHGDDDYAFQNQIIFTLGDIGDKEATAPLVRLMLRNDESRVRGTAAAALGKIGDNTAIEPLISVLENDRENGFVRDSAAWALLHLDEGKTALPLLKYLKQYHKGIFDSIKHLQFPFE